MRRKHVVIILQALALFFIITFVSYLSLPNPLFDLFTFDRESIAVTSFWGIALYIHQGFLNIKKKD